MVPDEWKARIDATALAMMHRARCAGPFTATSDGRHIHNQCVDAWVRQ